MHRNLAAALAAGLLAAGCSSGGTATLPAAQPVVLPSDSVATTRPAGPVVPTALPVATTAAPAPTATATRPPRPAFAYDVKAAQLRLKELRYYGGPVDGVKGPSLRSAVMAFQKVNGLGADGVVGKATLAALRSPKAPVLKATAPADRIEVDLTKQVLYVVDDGAIERILPISSGNGERYLQKSGRTATALTPVGWYKVQRRIVGERHADLGTLYDPQYFYKGWAIHGSNSVPAYPASHGCVRVTRSDAKWLLGQIDIGTSIYLYGGRYTFKAGSSAPGTDNPTGDTPAKPTPSPTAKPTSPAPKPTSKPTTPAPKPTPTTSPTASPTASPSPSATA